MTAADAASMMRAARTRRVDVEVESAPPHTGRASHLMAKCASGAVRARRDRS